MLAGSEELLTTYFHIHNSSKIPGDVTDIGMGAGEYVSEVNYREANAARTEIIFVTGHQYETNMFRMWPLSKYMLECFNTFSILMSKI